MKIGSPEFIIDTRDEFFSLLDKVKRDGIEDLKKYLNESGFFDHPASQYYHANFPGGLAWHSISLTKIALDLNKLYKTNIPEESIIISGLCHDLCKIGNYNIEIKWKKDSNGRWVSYKTYGNNNIPQCQHGPQSALIAARYIRLKEIEEQAICWHMGAFNQMPQENKTMGNAIGKNHLILLIQHADNASSTIFEHRFPADQIPGIS